MSRVPESLPATLTLPSDPSEVADARRCAEAAARLAGLDERAAGEVGLAVNEALANVIRHAYDGDAEGAIEVTFTDVGTGLAVDVRDWGNGTLPNPEAEHVLDPLAPGGLGLRCIEAAMDVVQFEPQPDGMRLRMCKRVAAGARAAAPAGADAAGGTPGRGYTGGVSERVDLESDLVTDAHLVPSGEGGYTGDRPALVASLAGEVDLHNSPQLRGSLLAAVKKHEPGRVVFDLAEVPYMDSSALAVFVEARREVDRLGGKIYLVNLTDRVRGLLEIARLDTIFTVSDSVDDALSAD